MLQENEVGSVVWESAAIAAAVAVVATLLVYLWHRAVERRTHRPMLSGTLALTALTGIVLATSALEWLLIEWRVSEAGSHHVFAPFHIWVDPGMLQRYLPLLAVVVTWLVLRLWSFVAERRSSLQTT